MTCTRCANELAPGARFCPICGQPTGEVIGRVVAGRYRIDAKLGEGGMGAVYRGEQISLKRAVAVKMLRGELSANPALLARFNAEAEAVAKLGHPNTVNIYDFGQDSDGSLFIAMEFIEGRSLRSVLAQAGALPPGRALAIAVQVAASLADAHARGIIHRDLKPDNVMLQDRGRVRDIARVLDFGIAKLRDDSRGTQAAMTQAGDMLGTPQYMAPEQINGEAIDGRTDVYALGCMLYEMVTGRTPFEAPTVMSMLTKHLTEQVRPPSARRPDLQLPPQIDQVVLAAMAKNPATRPATMEEYGELLANVLAALPDAQAWQRTTSQSVPPPIAAPTPVTAPTMATGYAQTPQLKGEQVHSTELVGERAARGGRAPMIIGLAAVVLVGSGVALWATQHRGAPAVAPAPVAAPAPTSSPPPADAAATIDAHQGPITTEAGTTVDVSQGVKVIVPPAMAYQLKDGALLVTNATHELTFIVGALDPGPDDPQALAKEYVEKTGFTLKGAKMYPVNGVPRPYAVFEGNARGVHVIHIVIAFLTPEYRIGVIVQLPADKLNDPELGDQINSFVDQRISFP